MRVLVVGAGGVGGAVAAIARRRDFLARMVVADLSADRARAAVERLGDDRFAAAQLDAGLGDDAARAERVERSRALSARFHAHRDGGNTGRVYRAIISRAGAAAGAPKGAP